jgi:hypothetical protein
MLSKLSNRYAKSHVLIRCAERIIDWMVDWDWTEHANINGRFHGEVGG